MTANRTITNCMLHIVDKIPKTMQNLKHKRTVYLMIIVYLQLIKFKYTFTNLITQIFSNKAKNKSFRQYRKVARNSHHDFHQHENTGFIRKGLELTIKKNK